MKRGRVFELVLFWFLSWLNKKTPTDETVSVLLMVAGAVVAYIGDMTFSFIGYALTLGSAVACAGYLVCIRFTKERTQCGEFEMMFYNNLPSRLWLSS